MVAYADFHRRSVEDRDAFWGEQAQLLDWQTPPTQICDYSNPPFAKWFVGGTTNGFTYARPQLPSSGLWAHSYDV